MVTTSHSTPTESKAVISFLKKTWNRDETAKLQFEGHFRRNLGFYVKAYCNILYIFETSRLRAFKLYVHIFKSLKFFWTAIVEPLRSHFAKIAHRVGKSKNFSKI